MPIYAQKALLIYLVGLLSGFLLSVLLSKPYQNLDGCQCLIKQELFGINNNTQKLVVAPTHQTTPVPSTTEWFDEINKNRSEEERRHQHIGHHHRIEGILKQPEEWDKPMFFHANSSAAHHNDKDTVADELARRVRVFCWIMTGKDTQQTRAVHVKATWARRCNKYVFISAHENVTLPAISLNVSEGRNHLWGKTKAAFQYAYEEHLNDFDWFLKADDDTYVIMENLRYLLLGYDTEEPIYFGCKFKPIAKQGYMSGGAGYVLSRAALRAFVERGMHNASLCRQDEDGAEDAEMGLCMEHLGVRAADTRDAKTHHRFFPFAPDHHLPPGEKDPNYWFWKFIYYPMDQGPGCCSDFAVSFHYLNPGWLYVMEYMVYHLRPFGRDLPFSNRTMDAVVAGARANRGPEDARAQRNGTHWRTVENATVNPSSLVHTLPVSTNATR